MFDLCMLSFLLFATEAAMSSHPSDSLENDDEAAKLAKQSLDALGRWSPAFDDD